MSEGRRQGGTRVRMRRNRTRATDDAHTHRAHTTDDAHTRTGAQARTVCDCVSGVCVGLCSLFYFRFRFR